ncbi:hypothetical protein BLNAU_6781 [Blattamonas nauphoetae]|uniref:Protein kinase domain-containing protein n=1 Tax=Blattamonas nauphoetae TaxID=2049346 RepID=A0ABQ9Y3K6_9EUKA|nr:hypothetical protein BLNAU_6781 [Blattamonas nauphoetae]
MHLSLLLLVCFIPVAFPTDPQEAADESIGTPIPLLTVISKWRANSGESGNEHVELESGVFHGHNMIIESESVLLSGKNSTILLDENGDGSGTDMGWKETLFCLRNGTFGIEKIDIKVNSAGQPKELLDRSKDKGSEGPYLVVVRSSTFWMVSCRVEMNDVNSPILVSSESDMVDSSDDTSVCLSKVELHTRSQHHGSFCAIEAGTGQSESVFIHVESSRFLDTDVCGRDGISFSLLPTCQERRIYPTISSSLSSMSFRNVSSSQAGCPQQNGMMSQKMVSTEVEWTDHHLSGSTIRDMNSGGSLLCVNSSFASCHTVPRDEEYDKYLLDYTSASDPLRFELNTDVTITFEKCTFTDMTKTITNHNLKEGGAAIFVENTIALGSYSVTITSCSFLRCVLNTNNDAKGGGAVSIRRTNDIAGYATVKLSTFTKCEAHGRSVDAGALHFRRQQIAQVDNCVFTENEAVTDQDCIGGGLSFLHLNEGKVFNSSFVRNRAGGGGAMEVNTVTKADLNSVLLDGNTANQTGNYRKSNDIWVDTTTQEDIKTWTKNVISTTKPQTHFYRTYTSPELEIVEIVKASQATTSSDETMCGILSFVDCRSIGFATCYLTFSYEYKVSVAFASEYEEETIVIEDRRTTIEGTTSGGTAPTIVPESTISSLFTIGDGSKQASLSLSTFTLSSSSSSLDSLIEVKDLGSLTLNGISLSTVVSGSCLVLGSGSSFTWTSLPFSDVTSTSNGSHILAKSTDGTIVNTSSLILHKQELQPSILFTEEEKRKFHLFGGVSGSMLYFWYPHTPTELTTHINEKGEDHSNCGKYELPCLTISTGLLKRNSKCEFVIESALSVSEVVSVSETSILKGSGSSARELLISDGTSFSVSGGVLTLSSLSFIAESSSLRTASLLSVGSGASLSVTSCSFSGFHSSSNGGVISAVLSVSSSLVVSSTAFSSCSSTQKGGGIHVTIAGGSFVFESGTSFTDCSASSGTDLFVSAPDLSSSITRLSMAFLAPPSSISSSSVELKKYVGNEDANPSYLIPLILYLMPFGSTGFVDESGEDGGICGFSVYRCSTIGKTQSSLLAFGTKTADVFSSGSIEVCGEVALAEKIEVGEYCLTITHPSTGTNGVVVRVGGEFSNAAPTSKLILSSLSISFATAISTSLFSISQGSVEIRNSKFVDVSKSASLFSLSGGSTLFESTTIGAISFSDTHSVFSLSGTSSLSIKSVDFKSICTTGSGSVISSTSEGTISLDTVSFSSCNCGSSEKGRSISVVRPSFTAANFVMKSVTIKVAGTTGLHEIYLSGSGLESLEMSGWESVIGENDGTLTKAKLENVFGIDSADVGKSGPLGYFLYAHTSGPVFVSEEFWDHEKCGQVQLPCSSLVHSMDQLPLSSPTIKVKSGLTVHAKISVPTNGLLLSSSDTVHTLTIGESGWFSHTSGLFSISTLAFVADTSTPRTNSLISFSSGSSISIDACSFSGFSVTGCGSIVSGTVSASSSLWITNTNFVCCSSSENGGVVCVVCESGLPTASLVVKGTFDTDCKCGSGKFGEWVFLEGHDLDELIATSNWAGSVQDLSQPTDQNKLWGADVEHGLSLTLLVYLRSIGKMVVIGGAQCADIPNCGHFGVGCPSIGKGYSRINTTTTDLLKISIGSPITMDEILSFASSQNIALTGIGEQSLSIAPNSQIVISSGTVSVSSLSFIAKDATSRTVSVLSVTSGASLSVTSCSFSGFSLSDYPVVDHLGGSLTLGTVSFSTICRSGGNGSCLSSKLESGMRLLIDGIELSETCVKNGYGDGLFISFPSDASSFTKEKFVLKNVVEKGRTRNTEDDTTPHLVWIVGIDFSGWISVNDNRFDSVVSLESSPSDWIWTEDIDVLIQLKAPLLFYLSPQEGPVGVDAAGYLIGKCGFGGVWCKTISAAMNRLSAANTDSIILQNELSISSELMIPSTLSISGKTPSSHFSVEAGCWFSISGVDTVFSLSTLVFSLPSSLTHSELFSQTSGTLSLTSVSFGPSESVEVFSSRLIVCSSALEMNDVNISSGDLLDCSLIETEGNVLILNSHFSLIKLTSNSKWIVSLKVSESVDIEMISSTFKNCSRNGRSEWILLEGVNSQIKDPSKWSGTFNTSSPKHGIVVRDGSEPSEEPFSLLYLFFPRGASLVTTTSPQSEDHRLCGHEKTPCSTISQNVVVSGVRSVSVKESCVVGGSLDVNGEGLDVHGLHGNRGIVRFDGSSRITQSVVAFPHAIMFSSVDIDVSLSTLSEESWIVEVGSGRVELTGCSFVSSKRIEMGMLVVENGELSLKKMTLKNVGFSSRAIVVRNGTSSIDELIVTDSSLRSLIDVTNVSSLTMINSRFERISWTGASNEDGMGSLCHWSDGVFVLVNSSTTVQSCVFQDLSEGGLSVFGGRLDIHLSGFEETHDESPDFPSAHRNIHCEGSGQVTLHSLSGGDGTGNHSSLWIDSSDCLIMNGKTEVSSPLFVPTLNVSESVVSRTKTKMMSMTIRGLILMPCGLSLEVFSVDDKKIETGTPHKIDLESRATNWTETSFSVLLNESSDFISLNSKLEFRGRLAVGDSFRTEESLLLRVSQSDERKSQMVQAMKWFIPVVAGSVLALIIVLVIICIVCRRRMKDKENKTKLSEMGEVDVQQLDIKYDDMSVEITNRLHQSSFDTPTTENKMMSTDPDFPRRLQDGDDVINRTEKKRSDIPVDVYAVSRSDAQVDVVQIRESLYTRLHKRNPDITLDHAMIQKQVVKAVVAMKQKLGPTEILAQINPHNILFNKDDEVTISIQPHQSKTVGGNDNQQQTNADAQRQNEKDRWMAPEVVDGKDNLNYEKAAVFSLGLILWEIEKEEVPFREVDAINAQRQLGTGQRPLMTDISQSLVDLLEECLILNPKERPSLNDIDTHFNPQSLHDPQQPVSKKHVPYTNKVEMP